MIWERLASRERRTVTGGLTRLARLSKRGCRKSLRQNGNTLACASGWYTLVRSRGRRTAHASDPDGRPPALCWIMVRAATNTRSARVSRPRRNA
jgi:hypothetical protein